MTSCPGAVRQVTSDSLKSSGSNVSGPQVRGPQVHKAICPDTIVQNVNSMNLDLRNVSFFIKRMEDTYQPERSPMTSEAWDARTDLIYPL